MQKSTERKEARLGVLISFDSIWPFVALSTLSGHAFYGSILVLSCYHVSSRKECVDWWKNGHRDSFIRQFDELSIDKHDKNVEEYIGDQKHGMDDRRMKARAFPHDTCSVVKPFLEIGDLPWKSNLKIKPLFQSAIVSELSGLRRRVSMVALFFWSISSISRNRSSISMSKRNFHSVSLSHPMSHTWRWTHLSKIEELKIDEILVIIFEISGPGSNHWEQWHSKSSYGSILGLDSSHETWL